MIAEGRMMVNKAEVDGVALARGDRAMRLLAAVNRDPAEFGAPEEFRIDRARNQHLTFGAKIQRCVGVPLARLEMRATLEEVLRRTPKIRVEYLEAMRLKFATTHSTLTSVPATWA
ncbi:cytochrome P450 [Nocardioides sp. LS1]|uniref:cytochrome P450 n=1 Tax=Nocardioides sp. LS1 TaxID=1027620 RepID=UPI000F622937|nr:cytochrome P450 [Nocardioides sp. LS1]GCD91150.1 hypothetical protein NLS1_31560 [Nocardioides sp. LS1]